MSASSPTSRMRAAVPRHPACRAATTPRGWAMNTGVQSAMVTTSAVPGVDVTWPSIPDSRSQPRHPSPCRTISAPCTCVALASRVHAELGERVEQAAPSRHDARHRLRRCKPERTGLARRRPGEDAGRETCDRLRTRQRRRVLSVDGAVAHRGNSTRVMRAPSAPSRSSTRS